MKTLVIFVLFAFTFCHGQTVSEDLLEAQRELTIGHNFVEVYAVENRGVLSSALELLERGVLDSFLNAYALIKNRAVETRETMAGYIEPSLCKDNVRARWELQVTRYGQKLSQCLGISNE